MTEQSSIILRYRFPRRVGTPLVGELFAASIRIRPSLPDFAMLKMSVFYGWLQRIGRVLRSRAVTCVSE
jgi:hypothetical protein